jgi:hypothetical protein
VIHKKSGKVSLVQFDKTKARPNAGLLLDELVVIDKNLSTDDQNRLCITHRRRFSLELEMSAIEDPPDRLVIQISMTVDQMRLKKCEEGFDFVGDSSAMEIFRK